MGRIALPRISSLASIPGAKSSETVAMAQDTGFKQDFLITRALLYRGVARLAL
jgi:hypothetical protein